MRLNLVFHNIVKDKKEIDSIFCVTWDYYFELTQRLSILVKQNRTKFKQICFYFDDGYSSFRDIIFPKIKDNYRNYYLAIVTDWINQDSFLDQGDILSFKRCGLNICSHGVSHSALTIYKNNKLQNVLIAGNYQNTPKGKKNILKQKEVLYQLKESKKALEQTTKQTIDEFVLPYGLYNSNIIKINKNNEIYKFISTCDQSLDKGQSLKPRFLIVNIKNVDETLNLILNLK